MGPKSEKWPRHTKAATSFRLSDEARRLLAALSDVRGVSQSAIIEQLIRDEAERRGVQTQAPATE